MKTTIIVILLLSTISSQAQTTYDRKQDKRTDTLTFAVTKMLSFIQLQDDKIKCQDSIIKAFKAGIVPYNKINYIYPLQGSKDSLPNSYTERLNMEGVWEFIKSKLANK